MTRIFGILNATPDSFSDGGRFTDVGVAVEHGAALREAGADYVDVGGESTRPGASSVDPVEERARVIPIVRALSAAGVPVSIDTRNAATAAAAVDAGAELINDVSGGLFDPAMGRVAAQSGLPFLAMHWRGGADVAPDYIDVVSEVRSELKARVSELVVAGVDPANIILDPGLGFSKTSEHNWQILARLDELESLGHRIVIGASRKRFLAPLLSDHVPVDARDAPTAVISALAAASGVWAVRVHDVSSTRVALSVQSEWERGRP